MKFQLVEDASYIDIPNKLYHATYKQFLNSIKQKGLGNTKNKMWKDSKLGVVYLAGDPWVAESYAEESEWLDEVDDADEYLDNIVILEINSNNLDKNNLFVDENVLLDEDTENATWEYHGVIPWSRCKIYQDGGTLEENVLDEASIDPEGKYTDFGTGKVITDNIFDDKTHISFYDNLLTNPDYMAKEENLKGEVVMMSPKEYYQECADKIFTRSSAQSLINQRRADPTVLEEIKEIIVKYKRQVFLPMINYAEKQQEGLHRMLVAADLFGWDHKFPVLVVTWADEEKAKQKLKQDQEEYITKKIKRAVKETLEYSFEYLEDFIAQLENELADEFDEDVDAWQEINRGIYAKDAPAKWKVKFDGDTTISVQVEDVVYNIDYEDINFKEPELDDIEELGWNDLDLDDEDLKNLSIDDFLKKYGM